MLRFESYFDETGTGGDRVFAGYAGYCATKDVWESLDERWRISLEEFKIDHIHMLDLIHREGIYASIDAHWLQLILGRFSSIIGEHDLNSIWCAVDQIDWNENVNSERFLARFPKPLDLCFDGIVHQLRAWSLKKCGGSRIVPVFADSDEFSRRNRENYDVYKRHPHWEDYLGAIVFGSPRVIRPLQASDMVAYELGCHFDRLEGDYFKSVRDLRYVPTIGQISKPGDIEASYVINGPVVRGMQERFNAGLSIWDL